jgi:hypothetical protein
VVDVVVGVVGRVERAVGKMDSIGVFNGTFFITLEAEFPISSFFVQRVQIEASFFD